MVVTLTGRRMVDQVSILVRNYRSSLEYTLPVLLRLLSVAEPFPRARLGILHGEYV